MRTWSFVAKTVNGIQLRCLSSGIIPKKNADAGGKQSTNGEHLWRQLGRKFEELFDDSSRKDTCQQAQHSSQHAECNRLAEKLQLDIPFGSSHCQTNSNLASPLGDRN